MAAIYRTTGNFQAGALSSVRRLAFGHHTHNTRWPCAAVLISLLLSCCVHEACAAVDRLQPYLPLCLRAGGNGRLLFHRDTAKCYKPRERPWTLDPGVCSMQTKRGGQPSTALSPYSTAVQSSGGSTPTILVPTEHERCADTDGRKVQSTG